MKPLLGILTCINILLSFINLKQQQTIMATLQEVKDEVAALQADLDTKQQAIADAIAALQAQIAAGAGAATEADLQGIVDSLKATQADLDSTPTS